MQARQGEKGGGGGIERSESINQIQELGKSQWIVIQRLLSHVQQPNLYLSRLQRIQPYQIESNTSQRPAHFGHMSPHIVNAKCYQNKSLWQANVVVTSMDSSLEAFSHNPTDGSFATLPSQAAALPTI